MQINLSPGEMFQKSLKAGYQRRHIALSCWSPEYEMREHEESISTGRLLTHRSADNDAEFGDTVIQVTSVLCPSVSLWEWHYRNLRR